MKDPILACVYGPSSYGKTVDAGYAFPNGLFICKKGAVKSIESVCGYTPTTLPHTTLNAATQAIKDHGKSGQFDAIVIDEFDFLVEDTFRSYEKRYTGFKLFGELRKSVMNFRNVTRESGVHVEIIALEKYPKIRDDGTKVRGGPALTGDLPEKVPAMCDLVLRAGRDPLRRPWPGIYRLDINSADWVGKDRDNGTPDPAPMNLGEILRLNGYEISRHPSVPWQEAMVNGITAEMLTNPEKDTETVTKWYSNLLEKKITAPIARWTVRDAWDRAVLYRSVHAKQQSFF